MYSHACMCMLHVISQSRMHAKRKVVYMGAPYNVIEQNKIKTALLMLQAMDPNFVAWAIYFRDQTTCIHLDATAHDGAGC